MIAIGSKARDNISKFEGIVTGRVEYLNGPPSIQISAQQLVDGEPKVIWVDESRCVIIP